MVMIVAAVTVIVVLALPGYLWAMVRVPRNARRQLASDMAWGIVVGLVNWILTMSWGDSSQYSPIQVAISGALMVAWVVWCTWRWASILMRAVPATWGAIAGYAGGWSGMAMPSDVTGLWAVGLVFLILGMTAGLSLVVLIVAVLKLLVARARQ
ncbi:hypothetical protein BKD74_00040 [Corynebacterium diphtheriae]|uniref:hypothetical protein n=1 Tax=Corynebacterium diphtheriae TaxID=1717 RepID=UPI0009279279|nr:hypothetical protein [Corynebacterium diphtheriae]MBG9255979.1 hypothetical protein [Corynebacterium diphtheriae bv. mitis]OJH95231.1 hypothetical protein BKD74_00040 [Corynebacterium diphtheriae]CAB0538932.1 hypothetical protein CIP107517_00486 [Corynebacterium diphtheriae]CAB0588069.1 hypothetical protein CIP107535_00455 [Corynebacterium diphtheriae]CAB0593523.1 hypothetical protein CIP107545_00739 [Corynebacterium diphtheriae]